MNERYDAAVIGAGPGGYVAAIRLSQLGKKTAVIDIDESRLGGVCLNEGCIPVKSLLYTARLYAACKSAEGRGIEAKLRPPDMKKMVSCCMDSSASLRNGIKSLFKKHNVQLVTGRAGLLSANKIAILKDGSRAQIDADNIIIATGSWPRALPAAPFAGDVVISSAQALKLDAVPARLLIVGAGAIGVEFCSLFTLLGSKVTLLEMMPRILPSQDEEISAALARSFVKNGVEVLQAARLKSLEPQKKSAKAVFESADGEKASEFDTVLIAVGRDPNTDGLGLEKTGVRSEKGFVTVGRHMRTNVDSVYAVGDIVNTPMYAHVASAEGIIAAESICGIETKPLDYGNIPDVIFCEPQIASVGLSEREAQANGIETAVSRHYFKANSLAQSTGRQDGFVKVIADKKTQALIGAHIIGPEATEIVHEFALARNSGLKAGDIAGVIHGHPTFSETAMEAARAVFGKPIHG